MGVIDAAIHTEIQKLVAEQKRTNQLLEWIGQLIAAQQHAATRPTPPWQQAEPAATGR